MADSHDLTTSARDPHAATTGPPPTADTIDAPAAAVPYIDLTPHARGGLGEVFRASDPALNRTVAVKRLLDRHADHPDRRRRFLVEAEVTARLEHPGVVPVYRLFAESSGRPAYAMRFVQGQTFGDAIRDYHAGPPDPVAFRRLLLSFLQVCQTVAYAHSRGVIHRDLKPANVMIGKFGETLVVDWGLAKVVGRPEDARAGEAGEETLVPGSGSGSETQMGSAVGTPAYMSPEQAAGRWDVIDARSDVYGLGAVLYTLLTGKPPLETGNWPEQQQKIQRGDFPRPRQVSAGVPKPLEAVCLKAMVADPTGRYPSSAALAADVEHWLADEPVAAYREPLPVRGRRWMRRNRSLATAAVVLLVTTLAAAGVGLALLGQKNREVDGQRRTAETAQARAEAINRFLIDDLLKQADPANNQAGDKLTVRELLDKAADKLDAQATLAEQPEVEAEVRAVVGHAYEYLAANDKAERHFRRAWDLGSALRGPNDLATLAVRNRFVRAFATQGRRPEAEAHARDAFSDCERVLGGDHAETAEAANNLAEVYFHLGRFDEVITLRRQASRIAHKALGPDADKTLEIDNDLGVVLVTAGRPAEAVPILQSVAERRRRINPRHPELAAHLSNLGAALIGFGRFADAESPLRESVALGRDVLGADNPRTLASLNLLGYALEGQGRWIEAETSYLPVLADRRRIRGPTHYETQRTIAFLARLYAKQGRWPEAAHYLAELILTQKPESGRTPEALTAMLTAVLEGKSDPASAEPLLWKCEQALQERMWGATG